MNLNIPLDAGVATERFAGLSLQDEDHLDIEPELTHLAAQGAGIGAGVGAFIGAVVASIAAALTSVVLPCAFVLTACPMVASALGAGAGAANGTLVGALIGWGIPSMRLDTATAPQRPGLIGWRAGLGDGLADAAAHGSRTFSLLQRLFR